MEEEKELKEIQELSEEEVNYIIGLCSDVVNKKFFKTNKYTIYRLLRSMSNYKTRDHALKSVLGELVSNKKEGKPHKELVRVSAKILDELRED